MMRCFTAICAFVLSSGCDPTEAASATGASMTAAECASTTVCITFGDCGLGPEGTCKPTEPEHCRNAEAACEAEGRCTLDGHRCVNTSLEDCRTSSECRSLGHCSLFGEGCGAVTQEDCTESDRCKFLGMCAPNVGECGRYGHKH